MRLVTGVAFLLSFVASAAAERAPLRFVDESGAPVKAAWKGGDDGFVKRETGPFCVTAEHFVPMALTTEMLERGGDVVMRRGRTVKGRILSAGGSPIAGIMLRVKGDDVALGECVRWAMSDAAGRLLLDGIGPQDGLVDVVAPPGWLAPPSVRLAQARALETVVKLHPATAIALSVTSADATPLAGASARILPEWKRYPLSPPAWAELTKAVESWQGTTDATGRIALPPLPQRAIWRVVVEHPLHAPASVRVMAGRPSVDAALALKLGGRMELRAVDEAGLPLAGASARVVPGHEDDYDLVPKSSASGNDGILRMARVPPGRVAVEVSAPGMRPSVAHGVVIEDKKLASLGDVVLKPGVAIAGVVRSEGAPVEKAVVVVSGHGADGSVRCEVETAADGAFRCEGLDPALRAKVEVEARWHVSATREHVLAGTTDLEIGIEPAGAILVKARDPDAAEDVAFLAAALRRGDKPAESPGAESVDDDPASLRFMPVAPGKYKVAAWAPGYATSVSDDVEVVAGEESVVEIDLSRGKSVSGRVVEAGTGRPIVGARLSLGRAGVDATSGDDGAFTIDGVKGAFMLTASHDAYPSVTMPPADPEMLPPEGLVVEMAPGGSVEGFVLIITGDEGAPVAGATVQAGFDANRGTTTDAEGHYRLDGLPPGPTQIVKTDRPGGLEGREAARADIVAGQTARVDFGSSGTLYGFVRMAGEPVAGAVMGLTALPAEPSTDPREMFMAATESTTTDVDGHYVLRGVATGQHVLTIAWAGRRISRDVSMPLTHRHVELDIDVPDLHVAGRVVAEATGEPVAGATVTFHRQGAEQRNGFSSVMSGEDESGVDRSLYTGTMMDASDETGSDGAFAVYLDAPGKYGAIAWVHGPPLDSWKGDVDVAASRDDMVIALKPKRTAGSLRVRLVDAATGTALAGAVQTRYSRGGGGSTTGGSEFEFNLPDEGQSATLVAWAENRGPEVRQGIVGDGEGDTEISITMGPAGRLRLLAPEGALPAAPEEASKLLHLRLASGFDLGAFLPTISLGSARNLAPVAPGEWLLGPLPPGPIAVSIGDGAPRTVDVAAGETAELDLR